MNKKKNSNFIVIAIVIIIIVAAIVSIVLYKTNVYKQELLQQQKLNQEYENFTQGEITGTSLITLINKSIDLNNKNNVQKDSDGKYIEDEKNSIIIEVKFKESDDTFRMEQINNLGAERFIRNYAAELFTCTKKEYHNSSDKLKYMLFEQV